VDFTPDVQYIAAAGKDNKIVIWDLEMAQKISELSAHDKGITSLSFNDKGTVLVTTGNDAAISVWDVTALNIGKKKAATDTKEPRLVCSALQIIENNTVADAVMQAQHK